MNWNRNYGWFTLIKILIWIKGENAETIDIAGFGRIYMMDLKLCCVFRITGVRAGTGCVPLYEIYPPMV